MSFLVITRLLADDSVQFVKCLADHPVLTGVLIADQLQRIRVPDEEVSNYRDRLMEVLPNGALLISDREADYPSLAHIFYKQQMPMGSYIEKLGVCELGGGRPRKNEEWVEKSAQAYLRVDVNEGGVKTEILQRERTPEEARLSSPPYAVAGMIVEEKPDNTGLLNRLALGVFFLSVFFIVASAYLEPPPMPPEARVPVAEIQQAEWNIRGVRLIYQVFWAVAQAGGIREVQNVLIEAPVDSFQITLTVVPIPGSRLASDAVLRNNIASVMAATLQTSGFKAYAAALTMSDNLVVIMEPK